MIKIIALLAPALLFAAPATPSHLVLQALSQTEVSLSWQDNASSETGYKIFRDGDFIAVVGANVTSFKDSGLKKNTTYTYTVKASDDAYYNNILFAHGYKGASDSWDYFADYITGHNLPWNVYRTSVGKEDHIEVRARQLANYINSQTNIAENSLVALGHSMGGLDLRYIVSMGHKNQADKNDIFYKAAKKISKIYTFATPHKGINDSGIDDATDDMTKPNMKLFNEANPYVLFEIEGRKIPLLAYRFVCEDERTSDGSGAESDGGLDGLLKVKTQIFNGAPFTQTVFSGKHTEDTLCLGSYTPEKERTDLLDEILEGEDPYHDSVDIAFFEGGSCQGEEAGVFSSAYKTGGVNCLTDSACEDNKIASMMLYPSIKKESIIELYSDHDDDGGDDWVELEIHLATLGKPLCVDSFEKPLSQELSSRGATISYHSVDGGEEGLDKKISYINIK